MRKQVLRYFSRQRTRMTIAVLAMLGPLAAIPKLAHAQSRADSVAIGRLIAEAALKDAQRQASGIRVLSFVPASRNSQNYSSPNAIHFLALAVDSLLVRQDATPVCPWYVGGEVQPKLELVVRNPLITSTNATAEVMLACAAGLKGRGAFGWVFAYRLKRVGTTWIIEEKREIAIS